MRAKHRRLIARWFALACFAGLVGPSQVVYAVTPPTTGDKQSETAASKKLRIYEFLRKSGFSKRAQPDAAVLRGVITVERNGQSVATSTTRSLYRKYQPKTLEAIQAAIVNGTLVEAGENVESVKIGSLEMSYSDGNVLTVVIYRDYFEITTRAGTIRFTSKPLSEILYELLK